MKNKKGFTLIEIIVVLVLLALIGTGSIMGIIKLNNINKEKKKQELISNIKSSADVYSMNVEYISELESNSYVYISLSELIDTGYLDNIINPTTDKRIDINDEYKSVLIKKDYIGTITVEYPVYDIDELVEITKLNLFKGETFSCTEGISDVIKNSDGFICITDSVDFGDTSNVQRIKYKYTDGDNVYRTTLRELKIDEIPTPTVVLAGTEGHNNWYKSDVSLSYGNLCVRNGIDKCYRVNESEVNFQPIKLTSTSKFKIKNCIIGTTICGNLSNEYNIKIDKDFPTIHGVSGDSNYKKSVSIPVTIADTTSDIDSNDSYYCWNTSNNDGCSSSKKNFSSSATITKSDGSGTFYLNVEAVDKAGNINKVRKSYKFDNTKPTINLNKNSDYFVDIKLDIKEEHSGINTDVSYYCWKTSESGNCVNSTKTFIKSETQVLTRTSTSAEYLYIYVVDKAGNSSTKIQKYIFNPPASTIEFNFSNASSCYKNASDLPKITIKTNMKDNSFQKLVIKSGSTIKQTITSKSSNNSYSYQTKDGDKDLTIELTYKTPYNTLKTVTETVNQSFRISSIPSLSYNSNTNQLSDNMTGVNIFYSFDKNNYIKSSIASINELLKNKSRDNIYIKLSNGCNSDKFYQLNLESVSLNVNNLNKNTFAVNSLGYPVGTKCYRDNYKILHYFNDGTFLYMFTNLEQNNCSDDARSELYYINPKDFDNNQSFQNDFLVTMLEDGTTSSGTEVKIVQNVNTYYIYTYTNYGLVNCPTRDPFNIRYEGCAPDYDYYFRTRYAKYKFIPNNSIEMLNEYIPYDTFQIKCYSQIYNVLKGFNAEGYCSDGYKYSEHFMNFKNNYYKKFIKGMEDSFHFVNENIEHDKYNDTIISSKIKNALYGYDVAYKLVYNNLLYDYNHQYIEPKIWEDNNYYYIISCIRFNKSTRYILAILRFDKSLIQKKYNFKALN